MHASFVIDNPRTIRVNRPDTDLFQLHFVDSDNRYSSHARIELTQEQALDLWLKLAQKLDIEVNKVEEVEDGPDHHKIGPNL